MAEAMTPGQGAEAKEREVMLKRIAKLAKQQGSFHLACKKYTQVGPPHFAHLRSTCMLCFAARRSLSLGFRLHTYHCCNRVLVSVRYMSMQLI